ncbi:hypothetical protein niasHS_009915 [Heterodera schachtii]|uniref:Uncharacterized protein n=1 Tax=Heterodera schachtii TaxID=97005 RepID=A0ABD2JD50_HETSC
MKSFSIICFLLITTLLCGQFAAAHLGFFDNFFDSDEDFDFDELFKSKLHNAIGQRDKKQQQKKSHKHGNVGVESRSLEQLYAAALAEGGKLVVYAGGDAPRQQDSVKQMFEQRFPNMTLDIPVDYSVNHAPRVNLQMVTPGGVVPDIVSLQTLQEFARWKRLGKLLAYKPRGWDKVYSAFRDPEGYFTGLYVMTLGISINKNLVSNSTNPPTYSDFLQSEFANGTVGTADPNHDDAVLFIYKQIVDKYGWQWLEQFAQRNPPITCGGVQLQQALENGTLKAIIGGFGSYPNNAGAATEYVIPADNDPFIAYAIYGAILKDAKHPEAAKLFMSWQLDIDGPNAVQTWPVRTDVTPKDNRRQIWEYPNTSHQKFFEVMSNVEERQRFGRQVALFLDDTKCNFASFVPGVRPLQ